jgi:hypothetical protein
LSKLPEVGKVLAVAGFVTEIERLSRRAAEVPSSPQHVKSALYGLRSRTGDTFARSLVDETGRYALVQLILKNADYQKIERVMQHASKVVTQTWPTQVDLRFAGDAFVSHAVVASVVEQQVSSLVGSLAVAFLCAAVSFRSLRLGLMAVVPVSLTALLVFGGMSALKIPLGIATSMVAGIGIGVGVDYALHYMSQWFSARGTASQRNVVALMASGPAIVINAVVVGAGLLALLVSSTPPLRTLGALASATLFISFGLTLGILPALLTALARDPDKARSSLTVT